MARTRATRPRPAPRRDRAGSGRRRGGPQPAPQTAARGQRSQAVADAIVAWLIRRVDRTYRQGNWAGRGVLAAIADVPAEMAHWRPHPAQHTIAEMVLHMGYWKDAVTARLRGRPWRFDEQQNWPTLFPTAEAWEEAKAELAAAHRRLRTALRGVRAERLLERPSDDGGRRPTLADLVVDIATHDSYHAAQIFVLKRLYLDRRRTGPDRPQT